MTVPFTTVPAILLDIEGTTSSISFVVDVLFPYAARRVESFLDRRGDEPAVRAACDLIAKNGARPQVLAEIERLMHADAKHTGLKALQGLIWEEGYASGELRSHVYPDVRPALEAWTKHGLEVRIYSSGSIAAQKAFFGKTEHRATCCCSSAAITTRQPAAKPRSPASYVKIAADMKRPAGEILFVSDVDAELYAAQAAGFQVVLSDRPGNPPADFEPQITSFAEIEL